MDEINRKYHEVANIFPLMQGEEFEALKNDIAVNGQREPIWLHQDGSIIDGRNRQRACCELDIAPKFRTWDGNGSLVQFVVSLNLHRRHLTSGQKAIIAVDILPMLEVEAKERQREHAQTAPGKAKTLDQNFDQVSSRAPQAAEQAASIVGSNRQYVSDAKRIVQQAPEVAEMVRSGEMAITEAKQLARLEESKRAQAIQMLKDAEVDTVNDAVKAINRQDRVDNLLEISAGNKALDDNLGPFNVIYADPPWRYEHSKTDNRQIENHYPTMSLGEICDLPVDGISANDAVLFLWTTSPKLAESMEVIGAWNFTYRTCMIWDKDRIGMGYYARQQHELLLIATRGALPVPEPQNRPNSVIRIERDEKHSAKPCEFYEIIERMYPEYPKVELFARNNREGWAAWGNQA